MTSSTPQSPAEIVRILLGNTSNPTVLPSLVSPTATYMSLNNSNPALQKLMPYVGVHDSSGPTAILDTFARVNKVWENEKFEIQALFSDAETEGKDSIANVAVFGTFTYKARATDRRTSSPFSIWCRIQSGQVVYMQFMEDTFDTARSFLVGGQCTYRVLEGEEEVTI